MAGFGLACAGKLSSGGFMCRVAREALVILMTAMVVSSASVGWHGPVAPASAEDVELGPGQLEMATVAAMSGEVLWVDTRSRRAYEAGHVPGAVHVPAEGWGSALGGLLDRWQPGQVLMVYCDSPECGASERVAEVLREEMGLNEVYVLHGGWEAWQAWSN